MAGQKRRQCEDTGVVFVRVKECREASNPLHGSDLRGNPWHHFRRTPNLPAGQGGHIAAAPGRKDLFITCYRLQRAAAAQPCVDPAKAQRGGIGQEDTPRGTQTGTSNSLTQEGWSGA